MRNINEDTITQAVLAAMRNVSMTLLQGLS